MPAELIKLVTDSEEIKSEISKYQINIEDIKQLKIKNIDGRIYVELKVKKCL